MSAIVIAGDVSGSVTLKAPDNGAATVLTLPAVTDNIVVGNTSINTAVLFAESGGANGSSALTFNRASNNLVLVGTLTYGGVTAANSVTGTGSIVLSANPMLTGNTNANTINAASYSVGTSFVANSTNVSIASTSRLTYGGVTLSNTVTGTGGLVLSDGPTLTGNVTVSVIVANGVTGTATQVLSSNSTGGVYWAPSSGALVNIYAAINFGGF